MKLIIKGTDLYLTPSIKQYIQTKIGALDKFLKKISKEIKAEVEIKRTTFHHRHGQVFSAEVNLYLPKKILRAQYEDEDIRAALDKVKDKLKQEIIKYKEKKISQRRKSYD